MSNQEIPKPIYEWSIEELEEMFHERDGSIRIVKQEDGSIHVFEPTDEEYEASLPPTQLSIIVPPGEQQMYNLCTYLTGFIGSLSLSIFFADLIKGKEVSVDTQLYLSWPNLSMIVRPEVIAGWMEKARNMKAKVVSEPIINRDLGDES